MPVIRPYFPPQRLVQAGNAVYDALVARALVDGSNIDYVPVGEDGAVARNLLGFLSDNINIKSYPQNYLGYVKAFANAKAANKRLFFPAGDYDLGGVIPNFHDVEVFGTARINVDTGFYYVSPNYATLNTLYVDVVNGSDDSDGLRLTTALKTIQRALDVLASKGPVLRGVWTVRLAAGTYAKAEPSRNFTANTSVTIIGPTTTWPNPPTAVIAAGPGETASRGLRFLPGQKFVLQNVKTQDFSAEGGVGLGINGASVILNNCHFFNCWSCVNHGAFGTLNISTPCLFDCNNLPNSICLVMLFHAQVAMNFDGKPTTQVPVFKNATFGITGQEWTNGHLDGILIQYCGTGLATGRGVGFNLTGTRIWNCTLGARFDFGSLSMDNGVDFGEGTANACTRKIQFNGGGEVCRWLDTFEYRKTNGFSFDTVEFAYNTVGLNETIIWTPMAFKAGDINTILSGLRGGISYNCIHEFIHKLGIVVSAAQTQSVVLSLYFGSVATASRAAQLIIPASVVNSNIDVEVNTHVLTEAVTRTWMRYIKDTGTCSAKYTQLATAPLRNGSDVQLIFTARYAATDTNAVLSFRTGTSLSTLGRNPY